MSAGRIGAAVAVLATLLTGGVIWSVSDDEAETVEACVSRTDPPKRAEDEYCKVPGGGSYGLYRWQVAPGATIDIPAVGQPVYNGSFDKPAVGKTVRVTSKGSSTVTRGGLGVVSSGGGAKAGSGGS